MDKDEKEQNILISFACAQGCREQMEDKHCLDIKRSESGKIEYILLGVFDGHGGYSAADSAARIFPKQLRSLLQKYDSPEKALRIAFHQTNEEMFEEFGSWGRIVGNKKIPSLAGTTATIVFIQGDQVIVAHCGDSTAVLGVKNDVDADFFPQEEWYPVGIRATIQHSVKGDEANRILQMGGKIGVGKGSSEPRVMLQACKHMCWINRTQCSHERFQTPALNMSRALGDFWSYIPESNDYAVSCDPYIARYSIQNDSIFSICLHTDGVLLSPRNIVRLLAQDQQSEGDKENASVTNSNSFAESILNTSHEKYPGKFDNATVIAVVFNVPNEKTLNTDIHISGDTIIV